MNFVVALVNLVGLNSNGLLNDGVFNNKDITFIVTFLTITGILYSVYCVYCLVDVVIYTLAFRNSDINEKKCINYCLVSTLLNICMLIMLWLFGFAKLVAINISYIGIVLIQIASIIALSLYSYNNKKLSKGSKRDESNFIS